MNTFAVVQCKKIVPIMHQFTTKLKHTYLRFPNTFTTTSLFSVKVGKESHMFRDSHMNRYPFSLIGCCPIHIVAIGSFPVHISQRSPTCFPARHNSSTSTLTYIHIYPIESLTRWLTYQIHIPLSQRIARFYSLQ
jgi:hypothetical protein